MPSKLHDILNWPFDAILKHFAERLLELALAIAFFAEGVLLIFSPDSILDGSLRFMLDVMSVGTIAGVFILIGASRIIALVLNGNWMPYGAYTRAVGAAVGALMLAQMDAALITFSLHGNALPFGTPLFAIFALFEAVSMYRALLGARIHGRGVGVGHSDHIRVASGAGPVSARGDHRGATHYFAGSEGFQIRSASGR
jgi:hypothetical protein